MLGVSNFGEGAVQPEELNKGRLPSFGSRRWLATSGIRWQNGHGNGFCRAGRKRIHVLWGKLGPNWLFQKSRRKFAECELFAQVRPRIGQNMQIEGRGERRGENRMCFLSPPIKKDGGGHACVTKEEGKEST